MNNFFVQKLQRKRKQDSLKEELKLHRESECKDNQQVTYFENNIIKMRQPSRKCDVCIDGLLPDLNSNSWKIALENSKYSFESVTKFVQQINQAIFVTKPHDDDLDVVMREENDEKLERMDEMKIQNYVTDFQVSFFL